MAELVGLGLLGVAVGTFGTLIGAGGGFILVPVLLFLYPREAPEVIAAISLTVVFFNALSGSVQYGRMRRIDYRSGAIFAIATIPGAVLGAATTQHLPRQTFGLILGSIIITGSALIFLLARQRVQRAEAAAGGPGHPSAAALPIARRGTRHLLLGALISLAVGYLSSLLGIGGGIIHVPALVFLLAFPVHIATATSHFVLAISALVGAGTHLAQGALAGAAPRTLALSAGVIIGAQIGARLATRIHSVLILRALAVALALVGIRVLWTSLG